jgi:aspartate kinase
MAISPGSSGPLTPTPLSGRIVVQKFGGSSVADIARVRAVAELVKQRRERGDAVCVVVSAMGKTTDQLLQLASQVARHPPRRELDMLLSTGERASAALLTMALVDLGVDAISFTGSQAGIITNATHAGARVLEVRPYRVQDELAQGRVVVLAGFQGVSYAKEITTLGRGGSDTTAVALAAALDADCEIFSDVDGVWTSDPRVVPEATKIEALSHEEMQELAAAGAKVLNAQAVQFAKAKGIAIYALKTPHASLLEGGAADGAGTVVRKDAPAPVGGVRGVAHRARLYTLETTSLDAVAPLLGHLQGHHIDSGQIVGWHRGAQCLVPLEDAHNFDRVTATLPPGCTRGADVGAVSLVGQGILSDKSVVVDALGLLAARGTPVLGVSTSSFRVTFLVPTGDDVGAVARALHQRFVPAVREEPTPG